MEVKAVAQGLVEVLFCGPQKLLPLCKGRFLAVRPPLERIGPVLKAICVDVFLAGDSAALLDALGVEGGEQFAVLRRTVREERNVRQRILNPHKFLVGVREHGKVVMKWFCISHDWSTASASMRPSALLASPSPPPSLRPARLRFPPESASEALEASAHGVLVFARLSCKGRGMRGTAGEAGLP